MAPRIHITAIHEKWRFVCPRSRDLPDRNHTNWFPLNGVFRCRSCERSRESHPEIDPDYDRLWDLREERWVPREEIDLDVTRAARARGD